MSKLTASAINNAAKSKDKKKTVYVLGDKEVVIDIAFKESKIDTVIFDYLSMFEEVSRGNQIDDEFIRGTGAILQTLILREFSNVPMIPKDRNVAKFIEVAKVLYDTGILEEVINSYEESELNKVYDKLAKNSNRLGKLIGEYAISSSLSTGEVNA
ncbi:hypothetical protein [Paenibacillus sp. XY044]|uniref:hypothetical protein n=1 Tax=Paenibacillus sp. XY044 TaxID=2026089 RepID=UPI000B994CB9|nr:hypothetical protein [Paenibacillus sp. XY044]OZB98020.1 hypothetical protein CJP46_02315 [Paenibacillus sp. XY044]